MTGRPWRVSRGRAPRRCVERSTRLHGRGAAAARARARGDPRACRGCARPPGRRGSPQIAAEAGKPLKAARVEVARAMSTYTMAAVSARTLAGEMVPMDASRPARGRWRSPCAARSAWSARSRRSTSRSTSSRTRSRLRSRPAAPSCSSPPRDAALRASAGGARGRGRAAAGLAERRRRARVRDRRRAHRGRAGQAGDVHRLERRSAGSIRERAPKKKVNLELGNATPVIVEADADVEDAARKVRGERVLVCRTELHLRAADFVHRDGLRRVQGAFLPKVGALAVGDPAEERPTSGPVIDAGDRDRVLAWIEEAVSAGATILAGGDLDGELLRPTVVEEPAPTHISRATRPSARSAPCRPTTPWTRRSTARTATRYGLQAGMFTSIDSRRR